MITQYVIAIDILLPCDRSTSRGRSVIDGALPVRPGQGGDLCTLAPLSARRLRSPSLSPLDGGNWGDWGGGCVCQCSMELTYCSHCTKPTATVREIFFIPVQTQLAISGGLIPAKKWALLICARIVGVGVKLCNIPLL